MRCATKRSGTAVALGHLRPFAAQITTSALPHYPGWPAEVSAQPLRAHVPRLGIATGLQCIGIPLPGVAAVRFKPASIGEQIARQICMAGTDRGFDQYLHKDVTLSVTCAQSLPLFAQWPEDFDRPIEMLFRICFDRLANRYGQAVGDGTR